MDTVLIGMRQQRHRGKRGYEADKVILSALVTTGVKGGMNRSDVHVIRLSLFHFRESEFFFRE